MKIKFFIVFFLIGSGLFSQELPPIVKYAPTTYMAGNQNWMISQDQNRFVYFANNDGLLEFNGSNWELYPSPNETILRSVKVINNKIYSGSYMEFGFWTRHSNGKLKYTSLSNTIKKHLLDDEQFWNILNYDQWVIFQSLERIYIYDSKTGHFKIITPKNKIVKSFLTKNGVDAGSWEDKLVDQCYSKLAVPPRRGDAILFYSQYPDGHLDPNSLHGACPILKGTKWGANLWVWNACRYSQCTEDALNPANELPDELKAPFEGGV